MFKQIAVLAMVLAASVGCTSRPVLNVEKSPVAVAGGRDATLPQVQEAIVRAGTSLGWKMNPVRPGLVNARLDLRTHMAMVDVAFDTRQFSINYKDSANLDYGGGNIHKNYNGWVENLDRAIRNELLR